MDANENQRYLQDV